jgi:hypothetical protein
MKKYYLLFIGLILFAGCEFSYLENTLIGNTGPGGGIVFYLTTGGHGLESAPIDQDIPQVWSNVNNTVGTSTVIGTGYSNTDLIIAQLGHTNSAAKVCKEYRGGGFSDWFLPSKDELYLIYKNLFFISKAGFNTTAPSCYWSSSEWSSNSAWIYGSAAEYFGNNLKTTTSCRVRAIRAF